jgi:hypothetical protein
VDIAVLSQLVKEPNLETDYSFPASDEVKSALLINPQGLINQTGTAFLYL